MKFFSKIYFIAFFIALIFYFKSESQNKEKRLEVETSIFKKIILDEIANDIVSGKSELGFYISCNKSLYSFNKNYFLDQSDLIDVPENILLELVEDSKKEYKKNQKWSNKSLKNLHLPEGVLRIKKCLNKKEITQLFEREKIRQIIFEISKPILDKKMEHCIVNVTTIYFTGSASGISLFLKKIYGIWVVVFVFDEWIT